MNFPIEILFHICDYLDPFDLLSLEKTSRSLNAIVDGYIESKTTTLSALLHFCLIKGLTLVDFRSQKSRNDFKFSSKTFNPSDGFIFFHYSSHNYPIIVIDNKNEHELLRAHFQIKYNKQRKLLIFANCDSTKRYLKVYNFSSSSWEQPNSAPMNQKLDNFASQAIMNIEFCCFKPKHYKFFYHVALGSFKFVYSLQIDKKLKQLKIETVHFLRIMKMEILGVGIVKIFFSIGHSYLIECIVNYQQEMVTAYKFYNTFKDWGVHSILLDNVIISKNGMAILNEIQNSENFFVNFSFDK